MRIIEGPAELKHSCDHCGAGLGVEVSDITRYFFVNRTFQITKYEEDLLRAQPDNWIYELICPSCKDRQQIPSQRIPTLWENQIQVIAGPRPLV